MKSIEEMKAEQAKALAKLEAEHAIASGLPLPPKYTMLVNTGEKAWVTYEAPDLWAALDIMGQFTPLAFYKYKGTYTHFETEAVHDARTRDKGETDGTPLVAMIKTNQGGGYGPDVSLCFFAYVGADICQIKIDLKRPGYGPSSWHSYGARFNAHNRGGSRQLDGNRYILGDFVANNTLSGMTDHYVKWGTGTREAAQYTYALVADFANADYSAGWTDAALRLENIANAMHGERKAAES